MQYLLPILYPTDLTREAQIVLGIVVFAVNGAIYRWLWRRIVRAEDPPTP